MSELFDDVRAALGSAGLDPAILNYLTQPDTDDLLPQHLVQQGVPAASVAAAIASLVESDTPIYEGQATSVRGDGWVLAGSILFLTNPWSESCNSAIQEAARHGVENPTIGILPPEVIGSTGDAEVSAVIKDSLSSQIDDILEIAATSGATDIHIEPRTLSSISVQLRIDGILKPTAIHVDPGQYELMGNQILGRAGRPANGWALPDDGQFFFQSGTRTIDCRLSMLPTKAGTATLPAFVIRLLGSQSDQDLSALGLPKDQYAFLRSICQEARGLFLVTGPTGSGKTTTLYAMLHEILRYREGLNICTAEDPVEITVPGLRQTQINSAVGLTFARVLRALLRQDPDVILIGEIRDEETATLAVEAANTGHLVFATLHTNDALSASARLLDKAPTVHPATFGDVLLGVSAQRLLRVACPHCSVRVDYREVRHADRYFDQGELTLASPKGCKHCDHGFRGRVAIMEHMLVDDRTAELIARRASTRELRDHQRSCGFKSLWDRAIPLIESGTCALPEVESTLGAQLGSST